MKSAPSSEYSESLSFLLSQIGARSAQMFAERLAPFGMSPRAFGVLSNLAVASSQTQQQLADSLGIHRNNMVGLIDEMEEAGWVRRQRSREDRRAFEIFLTAKGASAVAAGNELISALDDELARGALSQDDERTMIALLVQLARSLALIPGVHPHLRTFPGH